MQRLPGIHRGLMKLQFLLSIVRATFAAELDGKRTAMASGSDKELFYPDSFGDLYGRVTELLGFQSNADEHKVQWLSMSGDDRFVRVFEEMIAWGNDEWPRIDRSWFENSRLNRGGFDEKLFAALGLDADSAIPENLKPHVAAGIQRAVENAVLRLAGDARNVCLAGGLGMNALLVSALERKHNVFVQPAAGNAGTAIGAVFHASSFHLWAEAGRESRAIFASARVFGGGHQTGTGELQAPIQIPADHR